MAKGMPSAVALLGLLAVAGYQNRDKLGGLLGGLGDSTSKPAGATGSGGVLGDLIGGLGGALSGAGAGGTLSGGLGELMDQFRQSGRGDKADSWIGSGENATVDAAELEQTLGEDTIAELTQKTGLSRADLLDRLSQTLPDAVNKLTPQGRLPSDEEASGFKW